MQITEIRVYRFDLPLVGSYTMSRSGVAEPDSTIVELMTDTGLVGHGEACLASPQYQPEHGPGIRAALDVLAPAIMGADPTRIGLVHATMDAALAGSAEAKAAVDIACWDLFGQATDRRVCDLLGGARCDPVPTYQVVSRGDPDECVDAATRLQADGARALQLKVGGRAVDDDIAAIRAVAGVREPGVTLAVDANRGWTTGEAVQVSAACADLLLAIEQPCDTYDECARARPHLRHPMILDESATDLATLARAIVTGVADGFGLKVGRMGGLSAMRAARDLCDATGTPMSSDDAWGGDIIAAACVHLGATLRQSLNRGAWIAQPHVGHHYDDEAGPRIVDGHIAIPDGPGLGLSIPDGALGDPVAVVS